MEIYTDVAITVTDYVSLILEKARDATYSLKRTQLNDKNYLPFLRKKALNQYYSEVNGKAVFDRQRLRNVEFRKYHLVSGEVFNKLDLMLCRNVMIDFNQKLQNDVLKKLHGSLFKYGYLC